MGAPSLQRHRHLESTAAPRQLTGRQERAGDSCRRGRPLAVGRLRRGSEPDAVAASGMPRAAARRRTSPRSRARSRPTPSRRAPRRSTSRSRARVPCRRSRGCGRGRRGRSARRRAPRAPARALAPRRAPRGRAGRCARRRRCTVDRRPRGRVAERVLDEVRRDLASCWLSPADRDRPARLERDRVVRRETWASAATSVAISTRSTGRVFERPPLVETGEQEEVLDEHAHPGRLVLDPPHRRREVLGAARRPAPEQLGVAADRGHRGAQLVGGIGEELAEAALRARCSAKACSIWPSIAFSDAPSRPTSVSCSSRATRCGEISGRDLPPRSPRSRRAAASRPGRRGSRAPASSARTAAVTMRSIPTRWWSAASTLVSGSATTATVGELVSQGRAMTEQAVVEARVTRRASSSRSSARKVVPLSRHRRRGSRCRGDGVGRDQRLRRELHARRPGRSPGTPSPGGAEDGARRPLRRVLLEREARHRAAAGDPPPRAELVLDLVAERAHRGLELSCRLAAVRIRLDLAVDDDVGDDEAERGDGDEAEQQAGAERESPGDPVDLVAHPAGAETAGIGPT